MKRLLVGTLSTLLLIGCSEDNGVDSTLLTVSMIESNDDSLFKKAVTLYEDDEYLISTYFSKYISSYPFDVLFGYEELKQTAIQDTTVNDTLQMQDYIRYEDDKNHTLAYHLENGSCLIFDKKFSQIIRTIYMERYNSGGPMSTTSGRRFYLKRGLLFLETVDFMS